MDRTLGTNPTQSRSAGGYGGGSSSGSMASACTSRTRHVHTWRVLTARSARRNAVAPSCRQHGARASLMDAGFARVWFWWTAPPVCAQLRRRWPDFLSECVIVRVLALPFMALPPRACTAPTITHASNWKVRLLLLFVLGT